MLHFEIPNVQNGCCIRSIIIKFLLLLPTLIPFFVSLHICGLYIQVHLVKNVYDQLFELGRTPHVSLYKELICQNLQVGDYAKTLTYLSRMAYSKLNIRKSEWIELFEKNSDRIRKNNLEGLLNELSSSNGIYDQTNLVFKTFISSLQRVNEQWTQEDSTIQIKTIATTN